MSNNPKIIGMDNDSSYWAVVSKSSSGGDSGGIGDGHFAEASESFDFGSSLKIPPSGDDDNRMFVQTVNGSYRMYADKDSGVYTVTIEGSVDGADPVTVFSCSADGGDKFELEIDGPNGTNGAPSLKKES